MGDDAYLSELGGLPGAPPPPAPSKRDVPVMGPGDVVLLDMNGEKWAFVNLKKNQCVPPCLLPSRLDPRDGLLFLVSWRDFPVIIAPPVPSTAAAAASPSSFWFCFFCVGWTTESRHVAPNPPSPFPASRVTLGPPCPSSL